jgi:hypothetical protein
MRVAATPMPFGRGRRPRGRRCVAQLANCETDVVYGADTCIGVGACTRSQRGRRDRVCPQGAAQFQPQRCRVVAPLPAEQARGRRSSVAAWRSLRGKGSLAGRCLKIAALLTNTAARSWTVVDFSRVAAACSKTATRCRSPQAYA